MAKRQQIKADSHHAGGTVWLTTFNDMVTLLMVFFVLLFSMGSMDIKRFKHFQNALQSAMGVLNEGQRAPVGFLSDKDTTAYEPHKHIKTQSTDNEAIDRLDETQGIEAEYTPKGIQLTLDDDLLFASGSATLKDDGLALLLRISTIIKPLNRRIRIEGHTDNVPIATTRYPSNWELSTERAINVVKYFINQGGIDPSYLSAVGYGDVKPKTDNRSAFSRSKNRRVEIILGQVKNIKSVE
jgi:chemotaxis protein MotB